MNRRKNPYAMTYDELKQLLQKYYAGATSVAEEQQLRHYFSTSLVPAEFEADRAVILASAEPEAATPSAELEQRIAKVLAQQPAPQQKRAVRWTPVSRLRLIVASIAAMAVVAVGIYVWNRPQPVATVYSDTCASADEAAAQTEEILIYVSHTMNEALASDDDLGGPQP